MEMTLEQELRDEESEERESPARRVENIQHICHRISENTRGHFNKPKNMSTFSGIITFICSHSNGYYLNEYIKFKNHTISPLQVTFANFILLCALYNTEIF